MKLSVQINLHLQTASRFYDTVIGFFFSEYLFFYLFLIYALTRSFWGNFWIFFDYCPIVYCFSKFVVLNILVLWYTLALPFFVI